MFKSNFHKEKKIKKNYSLWNRAKKSKKKIFVFKKKKKIFFKFKNKLNNIFIRKNKFYEQKNLKRPPHFRKKLFVLLKKKKFKIKINRNFVAIKKKKFYIKNIKYIKNFRYKKKILKIKKLIKKQKFYDRKKNRWFSRKLHKPVYFHFIRKKWPFVYLTYKRFRWLRKINYQKLRYLKAPWTTENTFSRTVYIKQKRKLYNQNFKPYLRKSNKKYKLFLKIWSRNLRNIKRWHSTKIIFWRLLYRFFNKLKRNRYKKIFRTNQRIQSNTYNRQNKFLKTFESRIDVLVLRSSWASSIQWSKNLIKHKMINIQNFENTK